MGGVYPPNVASLSSITLSFSFSFSFSFLISLSYPNKYIMILIVIGISDSVLQVLISIFFSFFFVKVLFVFNLTLWFLICIYNIFRFNPSTFNFLFFCLFFCQSFYGFQIHPSNQVYIFCFFNDNIDFNLVPLLLISYSFS